MLEAMQRHEGAISMTDSKDNYTTITLEPGQVAVVLGMKGGQINCQLYASPEVDATLDDDHSDIPFHSFLASTFLVRLDQEEDFAADLAEWYDKKLFGKAGRATAGKGGRAYSFPGALACPKNKPLRRERLEEPALS
jgi:hypothetical protein